MTGSDGIEETTRGVITLSVDGTIQVAPLIGGVSCEVVLVVASFAVFGSICWLV